MQKLNAVASAILLGALGLASGCGGDDEGSPTAPGWSIPDDAVLGTLSRRAKGDALQRKPSRT
jgi:hypothetical protein